jgi:hypothetical protein
MNAPLSINDASIKLATNCELALAESTPLVLHKETWRQVRQFGIRRFDSDDPLDFPAAEPVLFLANDRFEFARDTRDAKGAEVAVIIPARDECGDIADIAAWIPENGRLALWRGTVAMLGQHNLYDPRLDDPIFVHESVADWLRSGRSGIYIIRPLGAALLFASFNPTLGVRSESFGRRLRTTLIIPSPRVLVSSTARVS